MPTPNDGRWNTHEEAAVLRDKLVKTSGGAILQFGAANYLTYWIHEVHQSGYSKPDWSILLERLSSDMDEGGYAGIGEIGLYHFRKHAGQDVISYPPDFKPFLKLMDFAASCNIWLTLHAEPVEPNGTSHEEEVFGGIEMLFKRNPNLRLILAHTGMTSSKNARAILRTHPSLMMDVKFIPSRVAMNNSNNVVEQIEWRHNDVLHLEPVTNEGGELYEDWAELFEEMPDRFLVGTDARFGHPGWVLETYSVLVHGMRNLLGAIDSRAARMIAFENARRVFLTIDPN